jgi:hypothetical protein
MKKLFVGLLAAAILALSGCASDAQFNNVKYETFGIANEEALRDPSVIYQLSFGSVLVAVIFCETIIIPIYIIGWDLYEPVRLK